MILGQSRDDQRPPVRYSRQSGKLFLPDGSKMAKVQRNPKKLETSTTATVPASLHDVDFMVAKDSKRFADSGGWGGPRSGMTLRRDTFTPPTADAPPQAERRQVRHACTRS